jgi:hypothetical protein
VSGGPTERMDIAVEPRPLRPPPWRGREGMKECKKDTQPWENSNPFGELQSIMLSDGEEVEDGVGTVLDGKSSNQAPARAGKQRPPHQRSEPLIEVVGTVNGHSCRILVDCGASCNFASEQMVEKYHLQLTKLRQPMTVEVANGVRSNVDYELYRHEVSLPGFSGRVDLVITKLAKYDVILGMPWFKQYRPVIDWDTGVIEKIGRSCGSIAAPPVISPTQPQSNTRAATPPAASKTRKVTEIQLIYTEIKPSGPERRQTNISLSDPDLEEKSNATSTLNSISEVNVDEDYALYCSAITSSNDQRGQHEDEDEIESPHHSPPSWLQPLLARYSDVMNKDGPV